MTLQAMVWAWDQKGLEAVEKLVLLTLADESSDHSPPPSLDTVAAKCDLSMDELHAVLRRLAGAGLVDTEFRTATH